MKRANRRALFSRAVASLGALLCLTWFVACSSRSSAEQMRIAVEAALPPLERSAMTFVTERECFSCHHNGLGILTFRKALDHGFDIDPAVIRDLESTTFRPLLRRGALDDMVQAVSLSDPTPNDSYLLMAAEAAGVDDSPVTAALARRLIGWQRDGYWVTSDFRPPHSSSRFAATASAVRVIRRYAHENTIPQRDASIAAARQWLAANAPASTEDAAFRLMGLVWADADATEIAAARDDVLRFRKPSGGWSQTDRYEAEAYSTGEALVALRESGMSADDPVWQAGIGFLLGTQADDGTWHVPTRMISPAEVSPPYFTTGFPYGHDEFLSFAGSAWAVMALVSGLPKRGVPRIDDPVRVSADTGDWVPTALFGTSAALAGLLDGGLDPNSRTAEGTTLLMMAVPDSDKVDLLLARGADPTVRTASGNDALTLAAAYYGTAPVVRALLDAGVPPEPPATVRVRRRPLVFAAMTGDLDNVRALIDAGADPAAGAPIGEAVTFGHSEVVEALVDAGADAGLRESSGVNLLHWATITGRAAVVPVLARAGVPIDAVDSNGYTPLMYAATLDFGDTAVLDRLLAAGADRGIRNHDDRTPLEQARYYGHAHLAAALSE